MKKIKIIILLIVLFSASCYVDNKDNSRISISFGNNIPASVGKVHVAVYVSHIAPGNVLTSQSFYPGSIATISIPQGQAYYFVVVGEDNSGIATYSGVYGPINIDSPEEFIGISMNYICDHYLEAPFNQGILNINTDANPDYLMQENKIGADQYTVSHSLDLGDTWIIDYQGISTKLNTIPNPNEPDTIVVIQPYYTPFNLYTNYRRYFP